MKKIIFLIIIASAFSACKKTYTCSCQTTESYPGSAGYPSTYYESTPDISYTKQMTKRKATAACEHEGKSINQTYVNIKTNNGQSNLVGVSFNTECKLK